MRRPPHSRILAHKGAHGTPGPGGLPPKRQNRRKGGIGPPPKPAEWLLVAANRRAWGKRRPPIAAWAWRRKSGRWTGELSITNTIEKTVPSVAWIMSWK